MLIVKLTCTAATATCPPMMGFRQDSARGQAGKLEATRRGFRGMVLLVGSAMTLTGCISVNTPDKPIVIELNINIKQEVIYRLAADAGKTIDTNKDIF